MHRHHHCVRHAGWASSSAMLLLLLRLCHSGNVVLLLGLLEGCGALGARWMAPMMANAGKLIGAVLQKFVCVVVHVVPILQRRGALLSIDPELFEANPRARHLFPAHFISSVRCGTGSPRLLVHVPARPNALIAGHEADNGQFQERQENEHHSGKHPNIDGLDVRDPWQVPNDVAELECHRKQRVHAQHCPCRNCPSNERNGWGDEWRTRMACGLIVNEGRREE